MKGKQLVHERVSQYAQLPPDAALNQLGTPPSGLDETAVQHNKEKYGRNDDAEQRKNSMLSRVRRAFLYPFSVVLLVIAVISALTDFF